MYKILVTGSAGFIGAHLAGQLIEQGYEVVGIDNINDYYDIRLKYARLQELTGIVPYKIEKNIPIKSLLYPNYTFIKLDIEDTDSLYELFLKEKFTVICHLAAQAGVRYSISNPRAYINTNIAGFFNILENCHKFDIKHLIYASSSSVYGLNVKIPFSENDCTDYPVSLYAATKKANELIAHSYSHLYGIHTIGLRFFTVYGPWGRPDMAPFLFLDAILNNREIKIFNNGEMLRDFTYIDDIVKGVVTVISSLQKRDYTDKVHEIYNIGNSFPVKLMDFIDVLEKVSGKTAKKVFLPMQAGDVYKTYADTQKLEKEFGYKPQTDITQGVEMFVNWYKSFCNK